MVKQLQNLNPSKATGPDNIPSRVLKEFASEIAPYLCIIFQQSIDLGQVPNDWKHAKVSAIFKKGKRDEASNYRPISLTSVTCKVLEHIIFHSIIEHYDQHNFLVDYQHGFRKARSCETQLINTIEMIAKSLDDKKQTDLIVLDFSKAFDSVPHQRLLLKLEQSGIRNIGSPNNADQQHNPQHLLDWFKNWLCGRTQEVVMDGISSEKCSVKSGVPQGTVLGPLCFLTYINDLGNNLSPETSLKLFADDSLLIRTIESEIDAHMLQKDLDELVAWSNKWQMNFHPAKCSVLKVTNKKKSVFHTYSMLGQPLENAQNATYLGVKINHNLQWDDHVNYIVSKSNKSLGFIRRNFGNCPAIVKERLCKSLVLPILQYSSSAWDPYKQKHIDQLEMVQRTAARFVMNCTSREPGCVRSILHRLGWKSLQHKRELSRLQTFHKVLNGKLPITKPSYFKKSTSNYNTRNHSDTKLYKPHTSIDTYKYSFFPRSISAWNNLPPDIRDLHSCESFKNSLLALSSYKSIHTKP